MQTDCGCQIARAVVDAVEGILNRKRYLIHDSRPSVHSVIQSILAGVDVTSVKLPPQCPSLNAYAERFVRSIKESCLDCLILFGENSLRIAIREFVVHYLRERHHQGLGNRLILPEPSDADKDGTIQRRQRLGGMLNYYYRAPEALLLLLWTPSIGQRSS